MQTVEDEEYDNKVIMNDKRRVIENYKDKFFMNFSDNKYNKKKNAQTMWIKLSETICLDVRHKEYNKLLRKVRKTIENERRDNYDLNALRIK